MFMHKLWIMTQTSIEMQEITGEDTQVFAMYFSTREKAEHAKKIVERIGRYEGCPLEWCEVYEIPVDYSDKAVTEFCEREIIRDEE